MQPKTDAWTADYRRMFYNFRSRDMKAFRRQYGTGDDRHVGSVRYADINRKQKRQAQGRPTGGWTDPATIVRGEGTTRPELLTSTVPEDTADPRVSALTGGAPVDIDALTGGAVTARQAEAAAARTARLQAIRATRARAAGAAGGMAARGMLQGSGQGQRRALDTLRARVAEQLTAASGAPVPEAAAAEAVQLAAAALQALAAGQVTPEAIAEGAAAGDPQSAAAVAVLAAAQAAASDPTDPTPEDITPEELALYSEGYDIGGDDGQLVTVRAEELVMLLGLVDQSLDLAEASAGCTCSG